jgi:hypothetical protein
MAKRNNSASNVAERPVVSGAKSADVPGAKGAALAQVFIADADKAGQVAESLAMSRKTKLARLIGLGPDDRKEFRAVMAAKQVEINDDAKAVQGRTLRDYMEDYPKAGAIYAEASLWIKMAKAVDTGWKPSNDNMHWRLVSMEATKALDSVGKPSADGKNPELSRSAARKRGRQATTPQSKAINAVKSALKDDKGVALPKNNRNLAEVVRGIIADATIEELTEVAAAVQKQMDVAKAALEQAGKAAAKASQSSKKTLKEGESKTSQGATVKRVKHEASGPAREGVIKAEAPAARGSRRSGNGATVTR